MGGRAPRPGRVQRAGSPHLVRDLLPDGELGVVFWFVGHGGVVHVGPAQRNEQCPCQPPSGAPTNRTRARARHGPASPLHAAAGHATSHVPGDFTPWLIPGWSESSRHQHGRGAGRGGSAENGQGRRRFPYHLMQPCNSYVPTFDVPHPFSSGTTSNREVNHCQWCTASETPTTARRTSRRKEHSVAA